MTIKLITVVMFICKHCKTQWYPRSPVYSEDEISKIPSQCVNKKCRSTTWNK